MRHPRPERGRSRPLSDAARPARPDGPQLRPLDRVEATRVKKARAELAATALVVEAKRSQAGRTLFLPCGWLERGAPGLPLETWKERLYPVAGATRALPHLPVPALFAAAWARVRGGDDAPAFEELDTRAPRKGRRR